MPSYPGFYDEWAKKKTFAVGDVLLPPRIEHGGSSRQERLRSLHYQKYHLEETPLLLWRSLGTIFTSLLLASIASLAKSFMLLFLREAANPLADTTKSSGQETNDDEGGGWMLQSTRKGM
ncbi:hypothetical protein JHK87_020118 [Glycine soja]|nr:hypothetical protein JHK87_020118 [Glycine soja]